MKTYTLKKGQSNFSPAETIWPFRDPGTNARYYTSAFSTGSSNMRMLTKTRDILFRMNFDYAGALSDFVLVGELPNDSVQGYTKQ